jgi:hypothetical protein
MLFRELESKVPSGILADDMGGLPRPHDGAGEGGGIMSEGIMGGLA